MPFRLRNAGQSFQRFMDEVLSGLDFAFCYLDDILIGSSSTEEHMQHLHLVLQRLQEYGLILNMEKCELACQEIDFLGHHITAEGASPILRHVQAIQDFPAPQDKKQLQTFLGMVNFYRRFIPAGANILLPLTDALRADWSWIWAPAMQHSFQLVKDTLAEVATLTHPDPAADISLAVDASNTHIGVVLQQWQPGGGGRSGGWRPLSFFRKKLDAAQQKYSAFDRELLAAYLTVRHFWYMLDGRKFHILSDHKPLTQALHRVSDPWTPRVQRQLSFLAHLTSDIRHVPGRANVVADALSHPPPSAVASVKEPPGSLATARQGGKPNTSTPSVPEQRSTAAAGAARPPLSEVVSVNAPAGSLTTARQRGKPNPLPSSPALISGNGVWRGPYLTWRVFGCLYTTWGQLPTAATREDEPVPASTHETGRGQAGLSAGGCPPQADFMYVKRGAVASSLSPLYSGPYRVISRGEKTFHVDIGGRDEVISADRLKPNLGQAPVQPASPPKRGRPPVSPSGGVGGRGRPPE